MRQFDIYATTGGTYSTKPRPSVIVQAVAFEELDSITIIPLTTTDSGVPYRVRIEPSMENGLDSVSYAMVDKLTTIKKSGLGAQIGRLEAQYTEILKARLTVFVGLDPELTKVA